MFSHIYIKNAKTENARKSLSKQIQTVQFRNSNIDSTIHKNAAIQNSIKHITVLKLYHDKQLKHCEHSFKADVKRRNMTNNGLP